MLVREGSALLSVAKAVHSPGIARQGGIVQLEFRDVRTGAKSTAKAAPSDMLQLAETEKKTMQLLYEDEEGLHFMDPTSFEQITVPPAMFEKSGAAKWVKEGVELDVIFHDGAAVSAALPATVTVRVMDTPTDRLSEAGSRKAAVVDTGATVMVPAFVQNGEDIVVNTSTGDFVRRATS